MKKKYKSIEHPKGWWVIERWYNNPQGTNNSVKLSLNNLEHIWLLHWVNCIHFPIIQGLHSLLHTLPDNIYNLILKCLQISNSEIVNGSIDVKINIEAQLTAGLCLACVYALANFSMIAVSLPPTAEGHKQKRYSWIDCLASRRGTEESLHWSVVTVIL